jgi:uncharacterized membrane protein YphA (DoxX/SURF4 family)
MSTERFAGAMPAATLSTEDGPDHAGTPRAPSRGSLSRLSVPDHSALQHLRSELGSDRIYLLPLRVFIGVGWLRAFTEKAIDPGWRSVGGVEQFLQHQLTTAQIVFPAYRVLVTELFIPFSGVMAWMVMAGQLLAGVAILSGTFTSVALLGGIFMNLNFLAAGATEPSASTSRFSSSCCSWARGRSWASTHG